MADYVTFKQDAVSAAVSLFCTVKGAGRSSLSKQYKIKACSHLIKFVQFMFGLSLLGDQGSPGQGKVKTRERKQQRQKTAEEKSG